MWYIFGTRMEAVRRERVSPERIYKIGHATSTRRHPVGAGRSPDTRSSPTGLARMNVRPYPRSLSTLDGRHHMLFCYRPSIDFRLNPGRGYQIGYAGL